MDNMEINIQMKRHIGVIIISLVTAWVMIVGALKLNTLYQSNQTQSMKNSHTTPRLNIALVNEDLGVTLNNEKVNLGQNYTTQAEKAKGNQWFVVSQGIGNVGLKDGDYQLMIEIPTNFSEKLMDINNPNPDTAKVTYSVADSANANVKATAEKVGQKVVSQLNEQLVNVYFASVLDNLYTAQNNVSTLVTNDSQNVNQFNSKLTEPVQNFQSIFPVLGSQMESTVDTNTGLQDALIDLGKSANTVYDAGTAGTTSFTDLLDKHAKNEVTTAQFYDAIQAMTPDILGDQINSAMESLKDSSQSLKNSISGKENPSVGDSPVQMDLNLTLAVKNMQAGITGMDKVQQKNYQQTNTVIQSVKTLKDNFAAQFAGEVGSENPEQITLGDLIKYKLKDHEETDPNDNAVAALANMINERNREKVKIIQKRIDLLPFSTVDLSIIESLKGQAKIDRDKSQIDSLLNIETNIHSLKETIDSYNSSVTDDELKLMYPSTVGSNSSSNPNKSQQQLTELFKQYQIALQQNSNDVTVKYRVYTAFTSKTEGIYNSELANVQNFTNKNDNNEAIMNDQDLPEAVNGLLSMPLTEYVNQIGSTLVLNSLGLSEDKPLLMDDGTPFTVDELVQAINEDQVSDNLTKLMTDLNKQNTQLIGDSKVVQTNVQQQAKQLSDLQKMYTDLLKSEKETETLQETFNQMLVTNGEKMTTYLQESEQLKQTSGSEVDKAKATSQTMQAFKKQVSKATDDGENLNKTVTTVKQDFTTSLKNNNRFSNQFANVLNNAHQNGVKNENMLKFLANPVNSDSRTVTVGKQSTFNPFGWLVILYVVSLFLSFTMRSVDLLSVLDRKKDEQSHFVIRNLVSLFLNILIHFVLGIGFALVVGQQLITDKSEWPIFVLTIILSSILFGEINNYLARQFKTIGLGVGLLFMLSYIFTALVGNNMQVQDNLLQASLVVNPIAFINRVMVAVISNYDYLAMLVRLGVVGAFVFGINLLIYHFDWALISSRVVFWRKPHEES